MIFPAFDNCRRCNIKLSDIKAKVEYTEILPMLALRGMVAFPETIIHFDVQRDKSRTSLKKAMDGDQRVFLVAQKDIKVEEPEQNDLYKIGVVARVRQTLKIAPNIVRILVEGVHRARLVNFIDEDGYIKSEIEKLDLLPMYDQEKKDVAEAYMRMAKELFDEYCYLSPTMPKEIVLGVAASEDPVFLVEFITGNLMFSVVDKQNILELNDPVERIKYLCELMAKENNILSIENELGDQVRNSIDQSQRDYYLREQMRVISQELGDDSVHNEISVYEQKLSKLKADDNVKEKFSDEIKKLDKLPSASQEAAVIRQYLDICLSLPFGKFTKDKLNISNSARVLDKAHYGMEKVKERILELLAVRQLAPNIKGQIICLVGPPGVGKTSIAKSIAECMGRKYSRLSLGGVRDESDIRGHRKTYVGAMPGRIINAVKQANTANPLILLDEVDKMGSDFRGDPSSALLEVLDPEQNTNFVDHYVEVPFDLSNVLFITTCNTTETIPAPLLDRMEVISLSSYTREEKYNIAKKHLMPKQVKHHGLSSKTIKISDSTIYGIIDYYTREAGVRRLEQTLASLCRKAAKKIVSQDVKKVLISDKNLDTFLGSKRYRPDKVKSKDEVGVVNGLAWTSVGGEMMEIEVNIVKGTGKIELTGSLGKVIKESASIAISYVRSMSSIYGIDADFYKNSDIHIHAPEGAVPKDGPSAGVTMVTAIVSALTGCPMDRMTAMTGEVTLRGRVLAIGGLKEKSMAAYRTGVKTVYFPIDNKGDLDDVDPVVREAINFVPVSHVDDILKNALVGFGRKSTSKSKKGEVEITQVSSSSVSVNDKGSVVSIIQ